MKGKKVSRIRRARKYLFHAVLLLLVSSLVRQVESFEDERDDGGE